MQQQTAPIRLRDAVLDLSAGTLTRDGSAVHLRPKPYRLLCHMALHPGQVITKDQLIAAVWPDVIVTDDSLTQAIRDVRTALQDERAQVLQTIRGRGYLLVLQAQKQDIPPLTGHTRLPRLAVLPIKSPTGEPGTLSRVNLLYEDVVAGLTRYRTLNVISTGSARSAMAENSDPAIIAARLDADYLVEGIAHDAADGFQLRLSMTNAATRIVVWSEKFDCTGSALLGATDEIVSRILGRLFSGLELEAMSQACNQPTQSLTAYDHFAIGYLLWSSDAPETVRKAHGNFLAATQADPNFALAWTFLAWAEVAAHDYSAAPRDVLMRALDHARTGAALAPNEGRALSGLGYIQALAGEYESAEANVRRGLMLNPSNYDGLLDYAVVTTTRGRPLETLSFLDRVNDINPMRVGQEPHLRGEALYMLGRYAEAADAFQLATDLPDRRRAFLAAMLAKAGRKAEAIAQIEVSVRHDPYLSFLEKALCSYKYEHIADEDHLKEGLALAVKMWKAEGSPGLPEV